VPEGRATSEDGGLQRELLPVGAQPEHAARLTHRPLDLAGGAEPVDVARVRRPQAHGNELLQVHAQGLLALESEHVQARGVDHDDALRVIDRDHRLQRGVGQPGLRQGLQGRGVAGQGR
jgi:hypothetical protein